MTESQVTPNQLEDIVVTARKREETSISVPLAVTAVTPREIDRRALNSVDSIARVVPQLIVGAQSGSQQGGVVALRGISGPEANPFGDQAVAFNIDGVAVSKSSVRYLTNFDMAQIEVLKGPQALFYGKNSPAGIITIRTADPANSFSAMASAGYEFRADEVRLEGFVSSPLTDTLGIRVAGSFSDMKGYFNNILPPTGNYAASTTREDRTPQDRNVGARLTLLWNPTSSLQARFKVAYSDQKSSGVTATTQYIACPSGAPQLGTPGVSCKPGPNVINSGFGPDLVRVDPILGDGEPWLRSEQWLSSLELNYDLTENIKLTSLTGYYSVYKNDAGNYEQDYQLMIPAYNLYSDKEFSQELRIETSYDGPVNFVSGLFYGSTRYKIADLAFIIPTTSTGAGLLESTFGLPAGSFPIPVEGSDVSQYPLAAHYKARQHGSTYSAFLQMIYKPVDRLEIDLGGRYTHERKRIDYLLAQTDGLPYHPLGPADAKPTPSRTWSDFSPEATISYRPSSSLTFYGSYKHGFLSGGFNAGTTDYTRDIGYNPETIKGFEVGAKAALFGDTLRVNLAAYTYLARDLQLTVFENVTARLANAGSSRIKGVEADFVYRTPLRGLTLRGSSSVNSARYVSFPNASCYNGQTPGQGCVNGTQNLAGAYLPRAPKFAASAGFDYEAPMGGDLSLGLSADVNYTGSYFTDQSNAPAGKMSGYALLDGSIRLMHASGWEVAAIGRNLTDKYYFTQSTNVPFTADRFGAVARGREIMLRVKHKFGS